MGMNFRFCHSCRFLKKKFGLEVFTKKIELRNFYLKKFKWKKNKIVHGNWDVA
jgi:hypothetical protein